MASKTTKEKDLPFRSLGTGKQWFSLNTSCIVCGCVYVNICIYIWILLIITVSSSDNEDFNARPEGLVAHRNIYTEMFLKYGILFDFPAMIVSCISMMIGVRINRHGLMFPFLIVMFPHVVLIQLFSFYNHEQFDIYIFGVWLFQGEFKIRQFNMREQIIAIKVLLQEPKSSFGVSA